MIDKLHSSKSFTLVELLVVIGILAILTAAVFLVINPVEYLKQARDTTRMSDLDSIDKALAVLETQGITSFGTALTVYVSIADNASSTCGSLGLPSLPSGYAYACVTSANLQKINGTGWIPVDFTQSPALSLAALPIDPVNATSTGNYYTYVTGGSWELATSLESTKYKAGGGSDRASTDGGQHIGLYEVGSNKELLPIDYGATMATRSLLGWFKFDEGTGQVVGDASGNGHNGYLGSTSGVDADDASWTTRGVSVGSAGQKITVPSANRFDPTGDATLIFVFKTSETGYRGLFNSYSAGTGVRISVTDGKMEVYIGGTWVSGNSTDWNDGNWHYLDIVNSGSAASLRKDGVSDGGAACGGSDAGTDDVLLGGYDLNHGISGELVYLVAYDTALNGIELETNRAAIKTLLTARGITLP
jgi:type II secretory pathway pseudopilin PulG